MFHDQKEHLQFLQICSDFICLAALHYLVLPLLLSMTTPSFTLPASIMPHQTIRTCVCRVEHLFCLFPFWTVIPIILMNKLKGYKPAPPPDIKSIYRHALILSTLSVGVSSLLFYIFDVKQERVLLFSVILFLLLFLILTLNRLYIYYCLRKNNGNPNLIRHLLLVGSGLRSRSLVSLIEKNPQWGLRITGFLTNQNDDIGKKIAGKEILGKVDQLPDIVYYHYTDCVVYTGDDNYAPYHDLLLKSCASMGIDFATTQKRALNLPIRKGRIFTDYIGDIEVKLIKFVYFRPRAVFFKRIFDLTASSILITLCLPFWITIAISIKITSPGPVFFKQERIGKYGKKFILFKFRSMVGGAEKMQEALLHLNEMDGPAFKIKEDPRQTITGRFLRRTSLDELPQLFNVFRGDISLVGPRPAIEKEVLQYLPIERKRLSVPQGITCIWQVSGRNNIKFDEWMKLDLMYIDNLSTAQDFKILIKTIPAVLMKNGAY